MAEEIIGIKITTDAAQATQEVQKLDNAFEATDQSVKSLRTQMREAAANVQLMADKFGATSKEAVNAAKRAADLKDRIGDAKALTDAFNPDAKFKAVASSLAGVAGGFSALQGAMALFGNENKDVEKALLRVNAAMALSQGLQAVGESVDSFKQLGAVIKSTTTFQTLNNAATQTAVTIQKAFGIATVQTSVGFNILKGAIIATGIGALVVALGLVIQNFDKISNWIKNSPLGALAKGVGNLVEQFTDFIGITSEAERNLDKLSKANKRANEDIESRIKVLKAQGGSEKEVYELSKKRNENELNDLRNASKVKGTLSEEDQKKFRDLKVQQLVLTAEYNKKTAEENKKAAEEAKKKRDEADKKAIEDKKSADKMLLDLQKANTLSVIEDENQKALKVLEIDSKAKADEINQLKVHQSVKDELIRLNNQKFENDKLVIEKKAKDDLDKKQKEEQTNLDAFNQKITEIKNAAIVDDNKRAEAERLEKLRKQIEELEQDKQFLKLSVTEQAQIKQDLIFASEAEAQKGKNEITKKGLQDELDLLELQQKGLSSNSEAYFNNAREIENTAYKIKIASAQGNAKEIVKINKQHAINNIAIENAEKEAKKAILLERLGTIQNFGKDIQVLAGKNKELAIAGILIEKAAAIGTVVVNTVAATAKAVAKSPITLGLPWSALIIAGGIAQTALIIKSGIDQVKAIKAAGASIPGGGSISDPGSSGPSLSEASPMGSGGAIPAINQMDTPDLGGGGGGGGVDRASGDTIVRAYVVESDITNTQGRMQEIENRARFE
jgi:hypothetical protein